MICKLLVNPGSNDYPDLFAEVQDIPVEGQEVNVPDSMGAKLIRNGHAIDITPPPKAVKKPSQEESSEADQFAKLRTENKSTTSKQGN